MSDYISRQAAIDALDKWESSFTWDSWCDEHKDEPEKYHITAPSSVIAELPSAQTEPIRLWLDHELSKEEYERLKKDCAEQPIILLPKESAPHWIPCSEKLPENDDWHVVTVLDERGDTPYKYTDLGWYLDRAECWIIDAEQRNDVIAWMPLPSPYREEGDQDEID